MPTIKRIITKLFHTLVEVEMERDKYECSRCGKIIYDGDFDFEYDFSESGQFLNPQHKGCPKPDSYGKSNLYKR